MHCRSINLFKLFESWVITLHAIKWGPFFPFFFFVLFKFFFWALLICTQQFYTHFITFLKYIGNSIKVVFLILLFYVVTLKVIFFGDNVPKDKADKAMEAAKGCDAFLVLGSSLMTMSAFRLLRYIFILYTCFTLKWAKSLILHRQCLLHTSTEGNIFSLLCLVYPN